ncbi:MAG TPA: GAF domain-containing protein [Candidatus Limnocylindrales bacterium]|nr:GAF domain-containing protein [Candidatus Limnocylindrales bacterium]
MTDRGPGDHGPGDREPGDREPGDREPTDDERDASLRRLVEALAARGAVALRLEPPGLDRLLRSIAEATVALFDAEAASIALVDPDGRLRFRVAAGDQGAGVVGLVVEPGEGIAGFVLATSQPIAISDVATDPRFDREAAAATGYVPRSLLAVPLESGDRVIGVLEVLDRRGGNAFDLRDVSLAGVFARQAAIAIEVSRTERDVVELVAAGLAAAASAAGTSADGTVADVAEAPDWEAVAADAAARLATEVEPGFWDLVDRLARLRAADQDRVRLAIDVLDVALRHLARDRRSASPGRPTRGPSWRERAAFETE